MIFLTLGSQKFQFNRLLKSVDELIEKEIITETVFAQIGYSDYKPLHYEYQNFINTTQFLNVIDKSDIVICHGGTGIIITSIKRGKKVIAVPRLSEFGEHIDDHQIQLIKEFNNQNLICGLDSCEELAKGIDFVRHQTFKKYKSNTIAFINSIEEFLGGN